LPLAATLTRSLAGFFGAATTPGRYCTFVLGKIIMFSLAPGSLQCKGLRTAFHMQKK
jgi:hypothetical protein